VQSILVRTDVTSAEGVDRLFRETEAKLGNLTSWCPTHREQPLKPIEEYDWAFYQSMLRFLVKSPYLLTTRGLAHMKAQKWGRIVNITSEVYQRPWRRSALMWRPRAGRSAGRGA